MEQDTGLSARMVYLVPTKEEEEAFRNSLLSLIAKADSYGWPTTALHLHRAIKTQIEKR
jgi:hypothetical protein